MALPVAQQSSGVDLSSVLSALPATLDSFFGKTTTQNSSVSAAGQNALLNQLLSGTQGLAAVSQGQRAAGLYGSSTNTLLTNDLITRAAGQVNEQSKQTTTVQQPQLNPLKALVTTLAPSLIKSYGPQGIKLLTDAVGLTGPTTAAGDAGGGAAISGLQGSNAAAVGNYGVNTGVTSANLGTNVNLGAGATGTGTIAADSALGDSVLGGAEGGSIELGSSLAGGALGAAGTAASAGAVGAGTGAAITGLGGSILDGIAGYGAGAAGAGIGTGLVAADSALGAAALGGTAAGAGAGIAAGAAASEGAAAAAGGAAAAEGLGTAAAAEGGGDALAGIGTALVAAWVVCTELETSGQFNHNLYKQAAPDFASRMKLKPSAVRGYHYWAVPYTRLMRKKSIIGRISRAIIKPLAIGRAQYISGNKNFIGWFTFSVLEPICSLLGNTLARKRQNWESLYSQQRNSGGE